MNNKQNELNKTNEYPDFNIEIDEIEILEELDKRCEIAHKTRSQYVNNLLLSHFLGEDVNCEISYICDYIYNMSFELKELKNDIDCGFSEIKEKITDISSTTNDLHLDSLKEKLRRRNEELE